MRVPAQILKLFDCGAAFGSRLHDLWQGTLLLLVACSGVGAAESERSTNATHWSLQPLQPVQPPKSGNLKWAQTPIDSFIFAALEAKGMSPNPPADKRTLLRRVTFDLI